MPRSAIIWTRSRELSLKARYHLTHRMMISWSKCRPLNRSCAEVGSVIPGVTTVRRSFQVCTRTVRFVSEDGAWHARTQIVQPPAYTGESCFGYTPSRATNRHTGTELCQDR